MAKITKPQRGLIPLAGPPPAEYETRAEWAARARANTTDNGAVDDTRSCARWQDCTPIWLQAAVSSWRALRPRDPLPWSLQRALADAWLSSQGGA